MGIIGNLLGVASPVINGAIMYLQKAVGNVIGGF